ncbi:MAG: cytochrome c [Caulobacterales bacterium]|nr:cytochrome c [Caulobacterales bacterium]
MRAIVIASAAVLLCLAGAAGAQDTVSISPQQAVAARKAGMGMSGALMSAMKASIDAQVSPRSQAFAAGSLARWGRAMPGVFPAGSGQAELGEDATDARAAIWTARADFETRAATFAAAATRLQDLARADDAAGFAAQWTEVRAACQACHDVYKAD